MIQSMKQRIEKYVLQNAVFYGGTANPKAVLGKVLGSEPDLRARVPEVRKELDTLVREVNSLGLSRQQAKLQTLAPEMLVKEEKVQEELPPLHNAREGKVVTRFAPSPTGPLNIAHVLRAGMMNFLYAERYKGKFVLRIEDTDPAKIRKEYYARIQEDLKLAGIKWSRLVIQSEHMSLYYRHARELLEDGHAYMCECSSEAFQELKERKHNCPCRDSSPKENLSKFRKARKGGYREGDVVMRFKTSMKDPNPAVRDPAIMRVSKARHPLQGRKYSLWPLYNYANVIDDHEVGVTHVFRGKEHQHNTDIQRRMYQAFGWEPPTTINFGMIYLPDEKLHTRDIKEGIAKGKYSGWDDPRLHTVQALVRRGFRPKAFRDYAIQVGLTKSDIRMSWENIESFNRSAIDPEANRYMAVVAPTRMTLKGAPDLSKVRADLHPDFPKKGKRLMPVSRTVFLSKEDAKRFQKKVVRLKNLFNVKLDKKTLTYRGDEVVQAMPKLQWVSTPNRKLELVMPDRTIKGLIESSAASLRKGDLIQMERIGYARVERKSPMRVIWAHR